MTIDRRASLAPAVALMLACVTGHAQTAPPRARVGPLEAWVARGASGACQLQLHNVGETTVVAWSVSVRSAEARHTSIVEHDGWRDEFHLPSAVLHVPPQETRAFTVAEEGALGQLRVEIHLVVRADGQAHGMAELSSHVAPATRVLARMLDRRRRTANEAQELARKADAAVGLQGAAQVLASKSVSAMLETDGDWNWWRITEAVKAAEALPAADPKAVADLSAAIGLLREAHPARHRRNHADACRADVPGRRRDMRWAMKDRAPEMQDRPAKCRTVHQECRTLSEMQDSAPEMQDVQRNAGPRQKRGTVQ